MRIDAVLVATLTASIGLALVACESTQSSSNGTAEQDALAREKEKQEQKAQERATEDAALRAAATTAIERARRDQPAIEKHFDSCVGYVVFPTIARGGLGIGAAHGQGVVYERRSMLPDKVVGTSEVTQVTVGLQIGGQGFSEIIFFEDAKTLENFKKSNVEFNADASGVAGGEGGTAAAKYENGVAVYVFGEEGFMGAAAIGGQKFKYKAVS